MIVPFGTLTKQILGISSKMIGGWVIDFYGSIGHVTIMQAELDAVRHSLLIFHNHRGD